MELQFDVDLKSREAEERISIQPLTHCNREGEVYQRSAEVESQITSALALTHAHLVERAHSSDYQSSDYLQEECLVYLIREYNRKGQDRIVNDLSQVLMRRCAKSINERLQSLGPDTVEEAFGDVIYELFTQISDLKSDRGDFLQVRFWVALKAIVISMFKRYTKLLKEVENTIPLSSLAGYEPDAEDSDQPISVPSGDIAVSSLTPEQRILYQDGLHSLEEPYRTAFVLCHYCNWPIEAGHPSVPTISRHFNVTSRTIRTWLAKAEETLQRWRGENNETA